MTSYCGLPVFSLRDVLREIDAPPSISFENVSSKWQCVIATLIPLPRNNNYKDVSHAHFTAMKYLDAGVSIQWPALSHLHTPVKTRRVTSVTAATTTACRESNADNDLVENNARHSDVYSIASSNKQGKVNERTKREVAMNKGDEVVTKWREYSNTFDLISNGWADVPFKRPQIAMRNDWDAPGESMTTSRYHTLVSSFADVFNSSKRSHEVALPTQHEPSMSSTRMNMKAASSTAATTTLKTTLSCANNSCEFTDTQTTDTKKGNKWISFKSNNQLSNIVEMQYFYQKDCLHDDVQLPRFVDKFTWPHCIDDKCTKFNIVGESSVIASQRGAIRRWHINDDGEFTMQAVLCAAQDKAEDKRNTMLSSENKTSKEENVHESCIENESYCKCTERTLNLQNFDEATAQFAANSKEEVHDKSCKCYIAAVKLNENKSEESEKMLYLEEEEQSSLLTESTNQRSRLIRSLLYQENDCQDYTSVPARLVICGSKYSYDWFIHDDESNVEGVHASLDLLETPDEALPTDKYLLPILTVAVIMSNSPYAFLSPPNLPHMSITLNDSILIEQSRISEFWLDDVAYFMHRCQHWIGQPVVYEYLANNLQSDHYVGGELIPKLIYFFDNVEKLLVNDDDDDDDNTTTTMSHNVFNNGSDAILVQEYCAIMRRRIVMSLLTIAHNETYFELSAPSRASLMHLLHSTNGNNNSRSEIAVIAASSFEIHENDSVKQCTNPVNSGSASVETFLCEEYWNLEKWWPKPGCVMRIPVRNNSICNSHMYLPVVYVLHRPVFGTEKSSVEETVAEYFEMKELVQKPDNLFKYLATRKQCHDTLLDDLFEK